MVACVVCAQSAFSLLHPSVGFGFFLSALVLTVLVQNPFWIAASIVCAATLYLLTTQGKGWKVVLGLIPVFFVVSVVNPLFNVRGETVLFYTFANRPYTFEALLYGMQTAGMFVAIMLWFASYNKIMTADKLMYLFGSMAPSVVLVLTMILRLVPTYIQKAKHITCALSGIGLSAKEGSFKERAQSGISVLNALTNWALESSVVTADSMRARGYGVALPRGKKRTQFPVAHSRVKDRWIAIFMGGLLVISIFAIAKGCASAEFIPTVELPSITPLSIAGFTAFVTFLALPTLLDMKEVFIWNNSN